VGVFVNADAATINRVVERTGIGYAQLHGDEPPEIVGQIIAPCIKAFRIHDEKWLDDVRAWVGKIYELGLRPRVPAILLDAFSAGLAGGTGQRFNWELVSDARLSGAMKGLDPIILAGGLDSGNVERAIDIVKPWAVDVASGVEKAPGVKDLRKVEQFIRATREGDELKSEFWVGG